MYILLYDAMGKPSGSYGGYRPQGGDLRTSGPLVNIVMNYRKKVIKILGSCRVIFPFDLYLDSLVIKQQCVACMWTRFT